eukprot:ANDGO_07233.mRNA.1 hypothetical protein
MSSVRNFFVAGYTGTGVLFRTQNEESKEMPCINIPSFVKRSWDNIVNNGIIDRRLQTRGVWIAREKLQHGTINDADRHHEDFWSWREIIDAIEEAEDPDCFPSEDDLDGLDDLNDGEDDVVDEEEDEEEEEEEEEEEKGSCPSPKRIRLTEDRLER